MPYLAAAIRIDCARPEVGVPIGWWRSVYSSQNAFAEECFVDEVALAAGKDPGNARCPRGAVRRRVTPVRQRTPR